MTLLSSHRPDRHSIPGSVRSEIESELDGIETEFDVRVIFAIESGSRAWGFASPDSDFDVRFVYVHRRDRYLKLKPGRDVIERPISGELDIAGWDIKKALNLLLKPNPVLLEWLASPIRYRWDEPVCTELCDLSHDVAFWPACAHHYRHLGQSQYDHHIADQDMVVAKKYFYVLRPAIALHWLHTNPDRPPPMTLVDLFEGLSGTDIPINQINDLIKRKADLTEQDTISPIAEIDAYCERWLTAPLETPNEEVRLGQGNIANQAERLFIKSLAES